MIFLTPQEAAVCKVLRDYDCCDRESFMTFSSMKNKMRQQVQYRAVLNEEDEVDVYNLGKAVVNLTKKAIIVKMKLKDGSDSYSLDREAFLEF